MGGTSTINADGSTALVALKEQFHPKEHSFDLHLNGKYPLFGRQHEMQIGVSHNAYRDGKNAKYDTYVGEGDIPDLYRFIRDGDVARPENEQLGYGTNKKQTSALYGATRIHLSDDWALLAGARLTH